MHKILSIILHWQSHNGCVYFLMPLLCFISYLVILFMAKLVPTLLFLFFDVSALIHAATFTSSHWYKSILILILMAAIISVSACGSNSWSLVFFLIIGATAIIDLILTFIVTWPGLYACSTVSTQFGI
jgi:hypothetical protein